MAEDNLRFDADGYREETFTEDGRSVAVRAYYDLQYCAKSADGIQKMNLFVPKVLADGGAVNGYTIKTAPIFMPNTVGGYMPGPADAPGRGHFGEVNAVFRALEHGYVVACAGIRGRTTGKASKEFFEGGKADFVGEASGKMVGRAPAFIVDMKAAIRYLRHNADTVPGDVEKIITNGTSAGGALSALTGASGNVEAYKPYLDAIGAADERDDIFAASCYCPIHNLEHADMAYEWLFGQEDAFHMQKKVKTDEGLKRVPWDEKMPPEQMALSKELAGLFPAYVNGLKLTDDKGNELTLDENGEGSFKEFVKGWVIRSAQKEYDTHSSAKSEDWVTVADSEVEKQDFVELENGRVVGVDWENYIRAITRMKPVPAFDHLDLSSPENEEFGDEVCDGRHFTVFSKEHSTVDGKLASESIIRLMNPVYYVRDEDADTAPHWRIRHGAYDRDTAIAIPIILQTLLKNAGYDVDFFLPWGVPHRGDYDLEELFVWIDRIVAGE